VLLQRGVRKEMADGALTMRRVTLRRNLLGRCANVFLVATVKDQVEPSTTKLLGYSLADTIGGTSDKSVRGRVMEITLYRWRSENVQPEEAENAINERGREDYSYDGGSFDKGWKHISRRSLLSSNHGLGIRSGCRSPCGFNETRNSGVELVPGPSAAQCSGVSGAWDLSTRPPHSFNEHSR